MKMKVPLCYLLIIIIIINTVIIELSVNILNIIHSQTHTARLTHVCWTLWTQIGPMGGQAFSS